MCRGYEPWEKVTHTHYAQCAGTYHYAVVARELIKAGKVSLTLATGTTLLVAEVEDIKAVVISIVADKDIGEEFHECRFSDTSLPNQKDGASRWNFVLRCLDDPLLERLYITRNMARSNAIDVVVI